jgi:maleylacetate reductase
MPFRFTSLPVDIIFDVDAIATLAVETERMGLSRILLVSMPDARSTAEAERVASGIETRLAGHFRDAVVHVPVETLDACLAMHHRLAADGIIGIGGGSAIGLAKLVAGETGTPGIMVPTTYSGAEMTPFNAVTKDGVKTQRRSDAMMPKRVIYDVSLTLGLPLGISIASMMNAIAHSIEAAYAHDTNPVIQLIAEDSFRLGVPAMARLKDRPTDRQVRRDLLQASMMAGYALSSTSMALHHKLCHILGGAYDLPHAAVNAVVLPYAVAYNAPGATGVMARLSTALGTDDMAGHLQAMNSANGLPASLRELGLDESAIPTIVDTLLAQTFHNPVPLSKAAIASLLDDAFAGLPPSIGKFATPKKS